MLAVTILGNNSAIPAFDRHPTAQVVTLDDHLFLIDCGEGTQTQMNKYKIRRSRINHIFISHLHGDHYFGLIGLVTSMGLLGRTQELNLYGPARLIDIFNLQLEVADTTLPFNLIFHPLGEEGVLLKENRYQVSCFKVFHRIECWGFIFRQIRPPRRVNPEKARIAGIPAAFFDRLKWGEDYETRDGQLITNDSVTDAAPKPKSYAYSADTVYNPEIAARVKNVDMLYHETTYLKDLEDRATKRFHCTTVQAADIAKTAGVKQLLIGHFSSKYDRLDEFEKETREVFPDSSLALEGVSYIVQ
ncbi:MAG TPA: ribonuclease Z [Puia sp.]|nr:ribonuclease Z [Puia sp.]